MKLLTLCPQCGPDVPIDDDGCCIACGCDASGPGVDTVREYFEKNDIALKMMGKRIEELEESEKDVRYENLERDR